MDNNQIIETAKTYIGRPCLCIEVRGDKMHLRPPESKMIVFSKAEIWQMHDNSEYPSDWGIELGFEEHENQIVISMTDGMAEPYNHIYIFNK